MSADKVIPLTTVEVWITVGFLILCAVGFVPAVKNFRVVLNDKNNPKISQAGRKFVLVYLGLGVTCIVLMFALCIYSLVVRT